MRQISSLYNAFMSLFLVFKIFSREILPEYIFICPDPQALIFVEFIDFFFLITKLVSYTLLLLFSCKVMSDSLWHYRKHLKDNQ